MTGSTKTPLELFQAAVELSDPQQRAAYVANACQDNDALRHRVEALLKAHDEPDSLLDQERIAPQLAVTFDIEERSEQPGQTIGRYKLLQQIGEGGFGVVYMAEQEQPVRRRVALKVIKAGMDTRTVIARFEAERQALAMMDHPNIARVLDAGATDTGRPYFVMELVKGIPITQYCDEANLDTRQRLELFKDVCSAVQHAHQKGIIHRDLKPSNIMVTLRDDKPNVKVIDFGIAKATDQKLTEKTLFTQFGQMIGTPAYMSPEQAVMSEFDVDTRSDVYSLGVLLYELLTGSPPFDAQSLRSAGFDEMRRIIREQEPPKPSTRLSTLAQDVKLAVAAKRHVSPAALSKQLHGDLDWIVMKALEKDRTRRYESASAFAQDIERHINAEPVIAAAPSMDYRFRKFVRRNRGPMTVAAAIALLLIAGTVVSTWQAIRATAAEQQALADRDAKEGALTEKARALDESKAISTFLTDLLQSPDPTRDGREIKVVDLLDKAAKKLETDLADQPAQRARLQNTLAITYKALGLSREAIAIQEQVRDHHLAVSGPEHPDTLEAENNLATYYREAGRLAEALKLQEEVLPLRRKVHGPEDHRTITSMCNLALLYDATGRLDEALKLQEEVLPLSRRVNGPEHPYTLTAMGNLAGYYYAVGRLDEALKRWEEVLTLRRKVSGPEHPDTLILMSNLAIGYAEAGRMDEALKLKEEVLTLHRKVHGPEHPDTIRAMGLLALSFGRAGRLDEALQLLEQVLTLQRKVNGPEHPDTLLAMHNLASSYLEASRLDEALQLHEQVLPLFRKVLGPEHSYTLQAMSNLALCYMVLGRLDEALKMREETLSLRRKVLGPEHPDTLEAMSNLSVSYIQAGRLDEAFRLGEEALALQRKVSGPERPATLVVMLKLALSYQAAGRPDEALKRLEEVLPLYRKVFGPESPDTHAVMYSLAMSYDAAGRRAEALKLFEQVLPLYRKVYGPENPDTVGVMYRLAMSYDAAGRRAEALKLFEEALPLSRKVRGPEHPETLAVMYRLSATYFHAQRFDEAIKLLEERLAIFQRVKGPEHPDTLASMYSLAQSYHAAGRWDEARPLFDAMIAKAPDVQRAGYMATIALELLKRGS